MTEHALIDAYHQAMRDYEAAKVGTGGRIEAFTRLLVAEKVLTTRLGWIDQNLKRYRERYSP
jgi:hypothetical protein